MSEVPALSPAHQVHELRDDQFYVDLRLRPRTEAPPANSSRMMSLTNEDRFTRNAM
jgi:hypothetical protein